MNYECFDGLVGITDIECNRYTDGRPVTWNTSRYGLYLTNIAELPILDDLKKGNETLWDVVEKTGQQANREIVVDIKQAISKRYDSIRRPHKGVIGQKTATSTITIANGLAVLAIECAPLRAGYITIDSFGGIFESGGIVTLTVTNNYDDTENTFTLNSVANKHTTVSGGALELKMFDPSVDKVRYYISYTYDAGNKPKDTEICGCGVKPAFNSDAPYYNKVNNFSDNLWQNFIMIGGADSADLDLAETTAFNTKMYGLTINCRVECRIDDALCNESATGEDVGLGMMVALLKQKKWALLVYENVINSTLLNRGTMANRDNFIIFASKLRREYDHLLNGFDRTQGIVHMINEENTGCLSCRDSYGAKKSVL